MRWPWTRSAKIQIQTTPSGEFGRAPFGAGESLGGWLIRLGKVKHFDNITASCIAYHDHQLPRYAISALVYRAESAETEADAVTCLIELGEVARHIREYVKCVPIGSRNLFCEAVTEIDRQVEGEA